MVNNSLQGAVALAYSGSIAEDEALRRVTGAASLQELSRIDSGKNSVLLRQQCCVSYELHELKRVTPHRVQASAGMLRAAEIMQSMFCLSVTILRHSAKILDK